MLLVPLSSKYCLTSSNFKPPQALLSWVSHRILLCKELALRAIKRPRHSRMHTSDFDRITMAGKRFTHVYTHLNALAEPRKMLSLASHVSRLHASRQHVRED